MSLHRTACAALFILAQVAVAQVARAEAEADAAAKSAASRLIDEGNQLLSQGILASALTKYEEAYGLVPSAKIRLNIAEVHMRMGSIELAAQEYDHFLQDADSRMPLINSVRSRLAELEKLLGALVVECASAGVEIELDGRILGPAPIPRVLVKPGPHTLRARAVDRETFTAQVEVPRAESVRVLVVLEPLARPQAAIEAPLPALPLSLPVHVQATREEARPLTSRWWFWAGIGAVVLAGAGTAIVLATRGSDPTPELGSSAFDDWTQR